ncbi:hypothetical protein [Fluviicola sp.]|uniref:hypothetical protein n=1 Tax=Fluviicola sp. TaxID=1917219 RepID=UPI002626B404|nr:hypothetical protein [Fluviicola sp.]
MKHIHILCLLSSFLFFTDFQSTAQTNENIIQNILIRADYVENGVKGIQVSNTCDFSVLRKKYANDSLLTIALAQSKFSYILYITQDSTKVKPAFGYKFLLGKRENIEFKVDCKPVFSDLSNLSKSYIQFIPYSALFLPEGKQSCAFSFDLSGKDGFNAVYRQNSFSAPLSFVKPPVKIFECSLDSLVIKPFNAQGQAWDHSVFGTDAPDLDFTILVGDLEVGTIHKGNSYSISFPERPRVFRFLISENDEVALILKDTDDAFHDPIASWRFNSSNMKENVSYQQKEAKANLQAFSFKCMVGKTKK